MKYIHFNSLDKECIAVDNVEYAIIKRKIYRGLHIIICNKLKRGKPCITCNRSDLYQIKNRIRKKIVELDEIIERKNKK